MFSIKVTRRQCAVGHGGFHTGTIAAKGSHGSAPPSLNYVYDCGSESLEAFKAELEAYASSAAGRTDILFVSHLHSDHCNGIERLQGNAPAKIVVVPYLDLIDRLVIVLADADGGALSASMLQYFVDPVEWWRVRGAPKVIFLEAGDGDDPTPIFDGEPDGPLDGEDDPEEAPAYGKTWQKGEETRLASYLRRPRQDPPEGLTAATEGARIVDDGGVLAGAGSSFQLQWRRDRGYRSWNVGDWLLLPYVHPVDRKVRAQFLSAVKKHLKIRGSLNKRFLKILIEHLSKYDTRNDLVSLYRSHFGMGQNALSMSLYSGPTSARSPKESWEWDWHASHCPLGPVCSAWGGPVGWLSTGDAALRQDVRRRPWIDFFRGFSSQVRVMTLPHHGSKHNFHDEILMFDQLSLALATTVEARNRVAGLRETLTRVETRGIATHVVDDELKNSCDATCIRQVSS